MDGGWWWPGLLIQLAVFLTVVCGFVWWATWWSVNHVEKHIDKVEERRRKIEEGPE
jgi:hypothetical protein